MGSCEKVVIITKVKKMEQTGYPTLEINLNQERLQNCLTVPTSNLTVQLIYCGEFYNLQFDGADHIWGDVILEKYTRTRKTEVVRKLMSYFSPRKKEENITHNEDRCVWRIKENHALLFRREGPYGLLDYNDSCWHRTELVASAATRGIGLTHQLLEEVFAPLEQKIAELYSTVHGLLPQK